MDEKGRCGQCRYWIENPHRSMTTLYTEVVMGECHRNPPVPFGEVTYFPTTASDNWCGECKPNVDRDNCGKRGKKNKSLAARTTFTDLERKEKEEDSDK